MWKRYRYDGDEELLMLDTSEGARVLSKGDTVLISDQFDLSGRPFTVVGGKIPDGLPAEPKPVFWEPEAEAPVVAEPVIGDPPAGDPPADPPAGDPPTDPPADPPVDTNASA